MRTMLGQRTWVGAAALLVGLQLSVNSSQVSCQVAHPALLFHDIAETPGYKHRTQDPWKGWEASLLSGADDVLSRDFSKEWTDGYNRVFYRGLFARRVALGYQLTKKPEYGDKAKQALLNLEIGKADSDTDWAMALGHYCLAYDWVQPSLDPATDSTVRDLLASLADKVYKALNDNGQNLSYVSFADHHGRSYPLVGVAGVTLSDYTNTSALSSTPADWLKVGTDYLFVDDKLHNHKRSLLSFGFDELSGKHLVGAYKSYVIPGFLLWFQVHNFALGKNPLELFPAARRSFTSELWESLPTHHHNNYVTSGNTLWRYHEVLANLLSAEDRSYALNHVDKVKSSKLLPHASVDEGDIETDVAYCSIDDYSSVARAYPPTTSHLQKDAVYQVFRGNWEQDSEWLSLVTFNAITYSNRDSAHHDQLSMEYFGKGDLLIADAGEFKHVLDAMSSYAVYSEPEVFQNAVAVEDPRTPFSSAPWSQGPSRGFFKGSAAGLAMPVEFANLVQVPWMELLDVRTTPKSVIGDSWLETKDLTSPIRFDRTIAFPDEDYFAIVDRLQGTEPWVYRNVFRPASLNIVPSEDKNKDGKVTEAEVGHVNGDLSLGGTTFDWQALAYKNETSTGVTTSSLEWKTTNPFGKQVQLEMYSVPSSEVVVTKHVGRIAGYDTASEVFSPVVFLRSAAAQSVYRVTVLLSRYAEEAKRTVETLTVTGTGNALRVAAPDKEDFWYTGTGSSSFGSVATDADTLHLRLSGSPTSFTWLNGKTVSLAGSALAAASSVVDYLSWHRNAASLSCKVKTGAAVDLRLYGMDPSTTPAVTMDGNVFSGLTTESGGTVLLLTVPAGEHLFEITGAGELDAGGQSDSGGGSDAGAGADAKVGEAGSGGVDSGTEGGATAAPTPAAEDSGGCGCTTPSREVAGAKLAALLGLGAILTRRRRRSR